jgi:hypothetical protein
MELEKASLLIPEALYQAARKVAYDEEVKLSDVIRAAMLYYPKIQKAAQDIGADLEQATVDKQGGKREAKAK